MQMTNAQRELAAQWTGLIPWSMRRWYLLVRKLGSDEAYSALNWGLVQAAIHYDPQREIKFPTFACKVMYRELRRAADRRPHETVGLPDDVSDITEPDEDWSCLDCVPAQYRETLLLHVRDGYTGVEIAKIRGTTPQAATEHIRRALEYVRKRLR